MRVPVLLVAAEKGAGVTANSKIVNFVERVLFGVYTSAGDGGGVGTPKAEERASEVHR